MTKSVSDISHPIGMKPKQKFFAEVDDHCVNVDGAIELARTAGTAQAKAIYHAFRKHHAIMRKDQTGKTPEKVREEAFFKALEELGVKLRRWTFGGANV